LLTFHVETQQAEYVTDMTDRYLST